jgi:hypothetical protein
MQCQPSMQCPRSYHRTPMNLSWVDRSPHVNSALAPRSLLTISVLEPTYWRPFSPSFSKWAIDKPPQALKRICPVMQATLMVVIWLSESVASRTTLGTLRTQISALIMASLYLVCWERYSNLFSLSGCLGTIVNGSGSRQPVGERQYVAASGELLRLQRALTCSW